MPLIIINSIEKEAKEIIKRNKGDIGELLKVLNQMILIYSVLKIRNSGYLLQLLDLQDLKTKLQMELQKYNENMPTQGL